jgi:hypothetical protein
MSRSSLLVASVITLALSAPACESGLERLDQTGPDAGRGAGGTSMSGRAKVMAERLPAMPEGHPDLGALKIASRGSRRLSVEQIERSLEQIGDLPRGTVSFDRTMALSLGEPDYVRVTEESLETSPLFAKFMMDIAAFSCQGLAEADAKRPASQRVLTRFADVDENLRFLLLRFTGIEGELAKTYLPRLREVHAKAAQHKTRPNAGWEGVCMALVCSPEFLLY